MGAICARGKQAESPVRGSSLFFGGGRRKKIDRITVAEVSVSGQGWHYQRQLCVRWCLREKKKHRWPSEGSSRE